MLQQEIENMRRSMMEQENAMKNEWNSKISIYEQKITTITREG